MNSACRPFLTLLAVGTSLALAARAEAGVTIQKPVKQPQELSVCQNQMENAFLNNSGHYATANGGTIPYIWDIVDANNTPVLGVVLLDTQVTPPNNPIVRYMFVDGAACQQQPVYLRVRASDQSSDRVLLVPVRLHWVDNGLAYPNNDRIVGMTRPGSAVMERDIEFEVVGNAPIPDLRVRTYHTVKDGVPGIGELDVVAYDGNAGHVQMVAPCCAGGQCGTREWRITVGVTARCGGNPLTHRLTIRGSHVSLFKDDIEIDLQVHQAGAPVANAPGACADGVGAVMYYTVAELDLSVDGVAETDEETKGTRVFREKVGGTELAKKAVVAIVRPFPLPGYLLRLEAVTEEGASAKVVFSAPPDPYEADAKYYIISEGLPDDILIHPSHKSSSTLDQPLLLSIRTSGSNGVEVGGGTCRDVVNATSVEVELVSPTSPPDKTLGTDSVNGNFWHFEDASPVMKVFCRATALPDDEDVRTDLQEKLGFAFTPDQPITGSVLTWDSPVSPALGAAVFKSSHTWWEATATFTGLPAHNSDFGVKNVGLFLRDLSDEDVWYDTNQERLPRVGYSTFAVNHPGGQSDAPNWFHYYKDQLGGTTGYTFDPGLTQSHASTQPGVSIRIGPGAIVDNTHSVHIFVYDLQKYWRAWDTDLPDIDFWPTFVGVVVHERWHYDHPVLSQNDDHDLDRISDADEFGYNAFKSDSMSIFSKIHSLGGGQVQHIGLNSGATVELWDQEMMAGGPIEEDAMNGADISVDWAFPGSQFKSGQ